MNVYRLEEIAKDVRIAIDRNSNSNALVEIGDVDTLALDDIIMSKVVEAVRRVHSDAPVHLLDGGYSFGDAVVYWKQEGCGWVLLPEDFMRFVAFKMDGWQQAVFACLTTDDYEYKMQASKFKGIRGTAQNPKCFITVRPEGRAMEFYSSKSNKAKITQAIYIPYPKVDELNAVEICSKCYNAVVYTVAALVMAAVGDMDKSNVFNELAKTVLI
jgi:hypothetical protein